MRINEKAKKIVKQFRNRIDLIKYVCDRPSDSEGFQLIIVEKDEDNTQPEPIHSSASEEQSPIDNFARKEFADWKKKSQKIEKRRPAENEMKLGEKQAQNETNSNLHEQITPFIKIKGRKHENSLVQKSKKNNTISNRQNLNQLNLKSGLIPTEDALPQQFSNLLKDDSIQISLDGKLATVRQSFIEGIVLLDFSVRDTVSWQLTLDQIAQQATFGICQIQSDPTTGEPTITNIQGIDKDQQQGEFSFGNRQTVQLTLDPRNQVVGYFNAATRKSTRIRALPKNFGFQYYPYVFLKKGSVSLDAEWLINQIEKQQTK